MRDRLNLQGLKRSRLPKHHKIHQKAVSMMAEGHQTQELSNEEIMEIGKKYETLEIKIQFNGDIVVNSIRDKWVIIDEVRFYTLYHKGFKNAKGKLREHYHVQDVFYDLEYALASIVSHDEYKLGISKKSNIDIINMIDDKVEIIG